MSFDGTQYIGVAAWLARLLATTRTFSASARSHATKQRDETPEGCLLLLWVALVTRPYLLTTQFSKQPGLVSSILHPAGNLFGFLS